MNKQFLLERYERKSLILASQFPIEKWHELIGDTTIADAILDHTVCNIIPIKNEPNVISYLIPVVSPKQQPLLSKKKHRLKTWPTISSPGAVFSGMHKKTL